ncbi:MAG: hypothetical protein HYS22_05840 [Deltaproteobacteria bacterium]|nr:hypothetical protein [Deltaproteobacteria bacterium]
MKPRIVIGIPLATPLIYWQVVSAVLELKRPLQSELMVFQGALVDRARNYLIRKMLEHPIGATHLFFLDADILPAPDTLTKLLKVNQPIVSGLYRKRTIPHELMAFSKDKNGNYQPVLLEKKKKPLTVDVVGAGCLLIHREVFEKMKPPWFTSEWQGFGNLSEDFSFCEKARKKGFKIVVETSVRPLHIEPLGVGTDPNGAVSYFPLGESPLGEPPLD